MSIEYTYEITAVNEQARCMEVRYTSDGREPVLVGVRLPFEGETLEVVVDSFSPVRFWEEQEAAVVVPQVGQTGVIKPIVQEITPANHVGEIPQVVL